MPPQACSEAGGSPHLKGAVCYKGLKLKLQDYHPTESPSDISFSGGAELPMRWRKGTPLSGAAASYRALGPLGRKHMPTG